MVEALEHVLLSRIALTLSLHLYTHNSLRVVSQLEFIIQYRNFLVVPGRTEHSASRSVRLCVIV